MHQELRPLATKKSLPDSTKSNAWSQWKGALLVIIALSPIFLPKTSTWLPVYYSNAFFLVVILAVIGGLFVAFHFLLKESSWQWTKLDIAVALFAFYFLVRFAFSSHGHWSQGRFIWWVALFILYIVFRVLFFRYVSKDGIWIGLMLVALTQIIIGQLQLLGVMPSQYNLSNISGTFFNPAPYSGFLAVLFPFALYELIKKQHSGTDWKKVLAFLVVGGTLLVIVPAQSRAAWLALLTGSLWVLASQYNALSRFRLWSKNQLLLTAFFSISILVAIGYGLYQLKPDSASGRLLIWKVGSQMVQERPLLGHDPTRFASEYMLAQADYFASGKGTGQEELLAGNVSFAYNEFLQVAIELGILGLIFFIAILSIAFVGKMNPSSTVKSSWSIPLKAALVGWIVFACFSYPTAVWGTALLLVLILVWSSGNLVPVTLMVPLQTRIAKNLAGFGTLLFSLLISFWVWKIYPATTQWKDGFNAYREQTYDEAQKYYLQAFDVLQYEGLYLQHAGKCFSIMGHYENSNQFLELAKNYYNDPVLYTTLGVNYTALQKYKKAEAAYMLAQNMIPHRIYPHYMLAQMYYTSQQRGKAAKLAQHLLDREIKIQSQATKEMINQLKILSIVDF